MINVAHLYRRLRRWLALRAARLEVQQLAGLITQIEQQMEHDAAELAALRMQHRYRRVWLDYHKIPPAARPGQPAAIGIKVAR